MDLPQNDELDPTPDIDWKSSLPNEPLMSFDDENDIPIRPTSNPIPHPITPPPPPPPATTTQIHNPVLDSIAEKSKTELKKGQHQVEDIFTKSKRILKQHWEQTRAAIVQIQKTMSDMVPQQGNNLIYWQNPVQSGIVLGLSISVIITFMFLSSLAAIAFWLLAFLLITGLYKLYNYVMATFVGRVQDDLFESIFPPDVNVSERQTQAIANAIRINGTSLLKQARSLFLWKNLTNSILFGLVLFLFFYIGLSMNALTFVLIDLILLFTVPKIYRVYQVPIDRTAKQVLDQINQILAKITSKLPNKAKKA